MSTTSTVVVKNRLVGILVPLIFTLVGVGMMTGFILSLKHYLEFEQIAAYTQGEVTGFQESTERTTSNGRTRTTTMYAPVITFRTEDGHAYQFTSDFRSNPPAYVRGDEIEVMYDPSNPEFAEVRALANPFTNIFMIILAVVGLLVSLFGIGLFKTINLPAKPAAPAIQQPSSPISNF